MTTENTIINTTKQVVCRGIETAKKEFLANGIVIEEFRGKESELVTRVNSFMLSFPNIFRSLLKHLPVVLDFLGKEQKTPKAIRSTLSDFEIVIGRYMRATELTLDEVIILFNNLKDNVERQVVLKAEVVKERFPRPSYDIPSGKDE